MMDYKERNRKHAKERYWKLKEKGLCVTCAAPKTEEGIYCTKCKNIMYKTNKWYSDEYVAIRNENLKALKKNQRDERREKGLCIICGGEIDDKKYKSCTKCRDKRKEYYKNNKEYIYKKRK